MSKEVLCCVNNLQTFQYGHILQELFDLQYQVKLERCQNQCVGCRKQPSAVIDGKWMSFDDGLQMKQYIRKGSES